MVLKRQKKEIIVLENSYFDPSVHVRHRLFQLESTLPDDNGNAETENAHAQS